MFRAAVTAECERPPLELELDALRVENARLREQEKRSEELIRELRDAVAARDSFIAIAGHELRNPMSTILMAVTNLSHRVAVSGEPASGWLPLRLSALERQARLFIRRATTLLDVSRISSGNLRLEPEPIDLSLVVQEALDGLAPEFEQAKSVVSTALADSVPGSWDRVALGQIVGNLLQNAAKYGAGRPVHVVVAAREGRAIFAVTDGGVGISAVDRKRVFSRFERAVTQQAHGGFGLGLWITRQLVEASGGTIEVESEPGKGSIFTVFLPQAVKELPR